MIVALKIFYGILIAFLVLIPIADTIAGFLEANTKVSWIKADIIQYRLIAAGKKIRKGKP